MGRLNCIVIDCADAKKVAAFWAAALDGYEVDEGEDWITVKSESDPLIYFEVVPEGKAVKNRLHLNLKAANRTAEVARLVGLGASEVEDITVGEGFTWTNMRDVEGNEFCVSQG